MVVGRKWPVPVTKLLHVRAVHGSSQLLLTQVSSCECQFKSKIGRISRIFSSIQIPPGLAIPRPEVDLDWRPTRESPVRVQDLFKSWLEVQVPTSPFSKISASIWANFCFVQGRPNFFWLQRHLRFFWRRLKKFTKMGNRDDEYDYLFKGNLTHLLAKCRHRSGLSFPFTKGSYTGWILPHIDVFQV